MDELHSSWVVADDFAAVTPCAQQGNQSPAYFQLLWCVVHLLGHTPLTLRLLSLLAGLALIPTIAWGVWRWSGSIGSGWLAAWLVTVSPDCIFYAQEARPYALLQLSAAAHAIWFTTVWCRPTLGRRAALVVGGAWLFYLHYTAALFLVAEMLCWILLTAAATRRQRRGDEFLYRWRQATVDAIALAVLCLPAVGHLIAIARRRGNWSQVFHAWPLPYSLKVLLLLCGVLPVVAWCVALTLRLRRRAPLPANNVVTWSLCWFVVPVLLAWCATWSGLAALFAVRYVVASLLGAIVFAALVQSMFVARWLPLGSGYVACRWQRLRQWHAATVAARWAAACRTT